MSRITRTCLRREALEIVQCQLIEREGERKRDRSFIRRSFLPRVVTRARSNVSNAWVRAWALHFNDCICYVARLTGEPVVYVRAWIGSDRERDGRTDRR